MPSAAAKIEKPASLEGQDSLKSIVTIFEKKTRNLEKRKTRLDHLKKELEQGKELNEDQKAAVGKYDQVQETLELTRELQKSVTAVVQEHLRQSKRQARREQLERQAREAQRVRELLEVQEVLVALGSPAVRQCFLDGEAGAPRLSAETLDQLDQLYRLVSPEREECDPAAFPGVLAQAADHLVALLDARPRPLLGTTYKALREVLLEVQQSAYFSGASGEDATAPIADDGGTVAAATSAVAAPGSEEEVTATEGEEQQPQQEVPLTTMEDELPVNQVPEPMAEPLHQQQSQLPPPPATLPSPHQETEQTPIPVAPVVAAATVPPPLLSGDVITESAVVVEAVTLVSGRLDFFQESQIDLESPHMDPAVVAALSSVPAAGVPPPPPVVVAQQAPAGFVLAAAAPHHHPAAAPVLPHHSAPQPHQPPVTIHHAVPPQPIVPTHQLPQQQQLPPMTMDYAEHMPIPTVTFTNQSLRSGGHDGDRRPRRGGGPGGPPRGPRHGGYANGKGSGPQWQSNGSGHDRSEGHRVPPRQAGSGPRGGQHQGRGRPTGNRGPPRNSGVPAAAYAQ